MKKLLVLLSASGVAALSAQAQVSLTGTAYTQNFDNLATSGTANVWTDNSTLTGWYASQAGGSVTTFPGTYRAGDGSVNTGALYSFGTGTSTDRALGSVSSGTPGTLAYGVRLQNNTGSTIGNLTLSYTGEQWRMGGNPTAQSLAFSYQVSSSAITSSDAANTQTWTSYASLSFTGPVTGPATSPVPLDGNATANRVPITVTLTGITLDPGQEIFLRWVDVNDSGNDHGYGIDDLTFSYAPVPVPEPSTFALLGVGAMAGLFVLSRRKS
jgi:PEP-CTERM motif